MINKISGLIFRKLRQGYCHSREQYFRRKYSIHPKAKFGDLVNIFFQGSSIAMGEGSYINSGRIVSGPTSSVDIGSWCAIGHNVNIMGLSHDIEYPTGPNKRERRVEEDIKIGDHVWIGSNVFILQGVTIGDHAIIGANSVVTRDVLKGAIVGGVPAKLIRFKKRFSND